MSEQSGSGGFDTDIAVVGMAGRFPGARDTAEFWNNLRGGVESVTPLSDEQLLAAGVDAALLADPNYVKSGAVLPDMEMFDAAFFGFSPREASIMDPQHRHFLECSWEALENAGHTPQRFEGAIGVFGGSGHNAYLPYNLLTNPKLLSSVGFFLLRHTGNDKDFLTTRVSYLLNLRGPSVNVQTACSTSLVAIHMGCQSLLNRECDMALAGGVTIEMPHRHGYLYREGEILSPDGHCRPFDADSQGTVFGSGVGVVVLRRLADALADGDHVHAVIKGSAVNNDGAMKVGYLAPSVDGQAQAIAEALAIANVPVDSISYIETHGTGTPVGDPIEIAALTQAFRQSTDEVGFCGIGSVKSNIGHIDTAAGVASFIKVALAMQHRELPPSLHFNAPNPACDFESSPFYVNAALKPWATDGVPRRAAVSSLGVGGTNAHLVLEEAPVAAPPGASRAFQLLLLSAKTESALDGASNALADRLSEPPALNLADAAWTLQVGRQSMKHRRALVAANLDDAVAALRSGDAKRLITEIATTDGARPIAYMFAGGGAQYPNMGAELYRSEGVFRAAVDDCLALLAKRVGTDFKSLLMPAAGGEQAAARALERPSLALPALFTIQYAQARLWMSWGLVPTAMIGHSMGEYTAAHLAGVFGLDDALALVELRGRLFERLPEGGMLSVSLPAAELKAMMGPELSIAAINGPGLAVASGPVRAIEALEARLTEREIDHVRVRISVAAHSSMLEPILAEFGEFFRRVAMKPPTIAFVSNLSGTWITPAEATDPAYWVRHLRSTVRFADGLAELLKDETRILLEVGPGRTLTTLARQHPGRPAKQAVLNSLRHPDEQVSDSAFMLGVLGRLWSLGAEVDWQGFKGEERRRRVPLPSYCFDHQRHWIEPGKVSAAAPTAERSLGKRADIEQWFYQPVWKRKPLLPAAGSVEPPRTLVFQDECGLGEQLAARLRAEGRDVATVRMGAAFVRQGSDQFTIDPGAAADYAALIAALSAEGRVPRAIVHLWSVTGSMSLGNATQASDELGRRGFYSLLYLAQALGSEDLNEPMSLAVISDHLQRVAGESALMPEKALLLGPCRVIPREFPNIECRSIDVALPPAGSWQEQRLLDGLVGESAAPNEDEVVAWRAGERWVQVQEPLRLPPSDMRRLRDQGVYLITGGLGGVGLAMAEHLASSVKARLVLVGRNALPPKDDWPRWLDEHEPDAPTCQRIRQVMRLEALGAEVLVAAADVTDLPQMRALVQRARARFGTIHGVLHTAGVLNDGVIQLKDAAAAAAVLAPKVQGTLVLEAALAGEPLDFTVLFSSISSFSGLAGQVDYAAANAFLDAYAQERSARDGSCTVAVNWSTWQEVGMAAAMARQLGISTEPELNAAGTPVGHPLVERCLLDNHDERRYATRFSLHKHWLLDEHRVRGGEALIPGTGYLELVRAAFEHRPQARMLELRDVTFLAAFAVRAGEEKELRVRIRPGGQASRFSVISPAGSEQGGLAWTEHVRGTVGYSDVPAPARVNMAQIAARCRLRSEQRDGSEQPLHLAFGPRWSNIQRIDFGAAEAVVSLLLPEPFQPDLEQFMLHPALMDMATAGAQALIPGFVESEDFFVPASYGRVRVFAPLAGRLQSHIRYRSDNAAGKELAGFDITMMDEQGNVLVDIAEFTMIRVRDKALLARPAAASSAPTGEASPRPHATANKVLELGLRDGIRPAEGALVLERLLAANTAPQVIVSPQDLAALIAELRAPATAAAAGPATPAPGKDVAPLESALAAHEAVREAAASAHADRIIAYVVYDPDHSITISELRRHLRASLPDDLVPQTFIELDVLPRTAAGAIDRAALPNPFAAEEAAVGPRSEMERTIAALWQELLGVERVGVHDNFFDIGGHSLLSVRLISRLDKKIGVRLQHEHVVVNTLEQLAAKCEQMLAAPKAQGESNDAKSKGILGAVKQIVLGTR